MSPFMLDEKLLAELLCHARKELRISAAKVDQCREEWAVTFARRQSIIMPTWKKYIDNFEIALELALEPCFQFQDALL